MGFILHKIKILKVNKYCVSSELKDQSPQIKRAFPLFGLFPNSLFTIKVY